MIVLHHTEAKECTAQDIHSWHIGRGWTGIGYHYFIRKNGDIYKGRPDNAIGAHATNYNSSSIGICFEGNYMVEKMSQVQLKAGQELVSYLKKKYRISKVKRHKDLNSTDCPGKLFPFDEIANDDKKENLILEFQQAAIKDGFKFPKYGTDGQYGAETKSVMQECVIKKRLIYQYKNTTKLVQKLLGIEQDGLCGSRTDLAIRKFQAENKLQVDGAVGVLTWCKLLGIN